MPKDAKPPTPKEMAKEISKAWDQAEQNITQDPLPEELQNIDWSPAGKEPESHCKVKDLPVTTPKELTPKDIIDEFTNDIDPDVAKDLYHDLFIAFARAKPPVSDCKHNEIVGAYQFLMYHLKNLIIYKEQEGC